MTYDRLYHQVNMPPTPSRQPSRYSVLAACVLAIAGVAAGPNDAGVDAESDEASSPTPDATVLASDASGAVDATQSGEAAAPASDTGTGDDGPQYITPDGALPVYTGGGSVFDLLCVQDPGVVPFDYAAVQAPYTTAAACQSFDPEGHAAAHSCLCNSCFTLIQQCDALPLCQQIMKCAFNTGCSNVNSCYLAQGLCKTQIDTAGNGSVAAALSLDLFNCGQAAAPACPTQ